MRCVVKILYSLSRTSISDQHPSRSVDTDDLVDPSSQSDPTLSRELIIASVRQAMRHDCPLRVSVAATMIGCDASDVLKAIVNSQDCGLVHDPKTNDIWANPLPAQKEQPIPAINSEEDLRRWEKQLYGYTTDHEAGGWPQSAPVAGAHFGWPVGRAEAVFASLSLLRLCCGKLLYRKT